MWLNIFYTELSSRPAHPLGPGQKRYQLPHFSPILLLALFVWGFPLKAGLPFPAPCSGVPPVNLLEYAVPSPKALPRGVNIIYDKSSHVHGYQFSPSADDIYLKATRVFPDCLYFPYEFSVFITYKQYVLPKREECIFSLFEDATRETLISVGLSRDKVVFRYKGYRYRFKMAYGYQDRKWHTLGISMSGSTVAVTRDCRRRRMRPLRTPFPDLLPVANTSFSIGRCEKKSSVFQGLLKSVILVTGGDAAAKACPSKMDIKNRLDNYIRVYPGYSSLTPFHSKSRSVCEWSDVGNIAFDVHAKKLKVCINGVWREVKISSDKRKMDYLLPYQKLDSGLGAVDVEVFDLPGEGKFAAFAAAGVEPHATYRSNLYQWRNGKFYFYQRLRTSTAQSWEFFRIRNQSFLAVANYGLRQPTNSTLYKWNKVRKKFRYYQDIPSSVARDVEAFQVEGDHYLAVANHREGDNNIINSTIFKWSRKDKRFREFQTLPTMGAYDMTYFTVDIGTGNGLNHGLAVANSFDGKSTLIFSDIYRWQDGRWALFHSLETNGATDWEHFTINNDHYLAVANAFSFGRHNPGGVDSYRTNSTIYILDKQTFNFVQYQTLVTNSAVDWEYLNIGDEHYLFVTNAQYGGLGDRLMSNVYKWQGLDKFVLVHKLMTPPNTTDFEVFRDKSDIFLVLARADKDQSEVMKVKFV